MSSCARRSWKIRVLVDNHKGYRESAKNLAKNLKVSSIDANSITSKIESLLGEKGSKKLHLIYAPNEKAAYPNGVEDNTHYNVYRATVLAKQFAYALDKLFPDLAKYIQK